MTYQSSCRNEATNAIAGMQVDENTVRGGLQQQLRQGEALAPHALITQSFLTSTQAKHALSLVVRQLLWLSKEKKGEPILIRDVKTALKDMHQDKNNALAKHLMKQAQVTNPEAAFQLFFATPWPFACPCPGSSSYVSLVMLSVSLLLHEQLDI